MTKNGRVVFPEGEVYVVNEAMDCILVGRPALLSVGIDVERIMEEIALDQQVKWIETSGARLGEIGRTALSRESEQVDKLRVLSPAQRRDAAKYIHAESFPMESSSPDESEPVFDDAEDFWEFLLRRRLRRL